MIGQCTPDTQVLFPVAWADLTLRRRRIIRWVALCPFVECRRIHVHRYVGGLPRKVGAPCGLDRTYLLVDANPCRTAEFLAELGVH